LGNHPQAEEANEVIAALKVEHANQVQELASKQHVSEEEISLLRKEVSRLNSELAALIEAEDFLSHRNIDLEAVVSRLSINLDESSAQLDEGDRVAMAANSKVRTENIRLW
jgi:hypothetical protein